LQSRALSPADSAAALTGSSIANKATIMAATTIFWHLA
jgi:hypothetical protein